MKQTELEKQIKWEPTGGKNVVIHGDGFMVSYNPRPSIGFEGEETALCIDDNNTPFGTAYKILTGDFRKQYEKRIDSLDECIKFYEANAEKHPSSWTTN